ncbi:predicted protein [Chaetoceros tenuissimus]|uniref:Uncharacterized protein n=1 Tax=Chaetoceros tenuissimus TaxID=426638 RepID=A0AAD3D3R0_9STRA|nr:predicted protein [Chaetoceros tenuissimus]
MNHIFKNLPRAKEVNEQQGVMHSKTVSDDDDLTGQEFNTHRSQAVSNPFHALYIQSLPGKISFGEFQQQIYVRAQQLLKGKEENKNDKMVMQSILRNVIPGCQIDIRLANKPSNAVVSNLKEEDTVRRPKSILRNQDAKFPVDRNLANRLHLLTDDDEEEKTHEELLLGQSNCLNANSHVGAQKKTPAESKADEASSHISIHNVTNSFGPKSNARRHHVNAYTGRRINGSNAIYHQDAGSYLASFLRRKRRARRYPSLVIYHIDEEEEEEKSISSVMHATSQQKIQKKNGSPITDETEKFPNARFARNIAKSSNVVRKDRITVEIKKSFRGSYRDRSDTYLRQFELDNRGTVCSKDLHEQGKLRLRAIARRHLYIPVDRRATLIELGDQNSKGKWQGKHFCSSLSMIVEEEIELDVSTSAPNEHMLSSTTPATGPSSITTESTKPEIDLINSSTASSIASALDSSFRPSDPFPSSQSLFKVTKNGKRRKLNPASNGIIDATYSWCTSSPAPSPPPPVKIEVIAMANDCQMQKEMSSNDSDNLVQKSLAPTSPASQTSEQESQLQQINVSPSSLSSHPSGSNDIDRRKRRKRYRRSAACTSQHSHTTSLVQESPMTNENVPIPSSSSLAQSGPNDIARRKCRKRNRRASSCTSLHSSDTPSLVEESLPSSSPPTMDRGKQLKSNQCSLEASLLLLLPVTLLVTSAIEHAVTHCNSKVEKTVIKEQTANYQSDESRHRKEMFRASKANHLPLSVLKKQRQVLQLVETSSDEGFEWIPICIKQEGKKASKVKKKGSKELISRERLQRRAFNRRRRHTPTDINMKKLLTAHLYREKRGNASKVKSKKEKKGGGRSRSRRVLGTIQEETLVECRDGGFLDSLENPSISCIKTSSLRKG